MSVKGALAGVKVLDFSTLLPGPMATLFLADAGAEVIKIERPRTGDDMRGYDPKWGPDGINFAMLNRGKKSLAVDLKDPAVIERLKPLFLEADIVVEQFRPGVMDRLGIGYDALRELNPAIIYCAITGYGQTGPKSLVAGHDLNYIGDAGLLALSMGSAVQPTVPPALIADIAGGAYPATVNILLALRERDRTGEGAFLDVSMSDNLFPFLYWAMGAGMVTGDFPGNGDSLVTGGGPRYQLYPTADGRMVAAAPIEQKFWDSFCAAIELDPALRDDGKDAARTKQAVADIIAGQTAEHWRGVFEKADCCCTIVKSVGEAMQDPHFNARGLFDKRVTGSAGEGVTALPTPIAPPLRAAETERSYPGLGTDNEEVLP